MTALMLKLDGYLLQKYIALLVTIIGWTKIEIAAVLLYA